MTAKRHIAHAIFPSPRPVIHFAADPVRLNPCFSCASALFCSIYTRVYITRLFISVVCTLFRATRGWAAKAAHWGRPSPRRAELGDQKVALFTNLLPRFLHGNHSLHELYTPV